MVPWWGLVVAFFAGIFIGIALIAIVAANDFDEQPNKTRWYG